MNHKKWNPGSLYAQAMRDITNEHNACVDAWQAAEAEAERLGRENDKLCDEIQQLRQGWQNSHKAEDELAALRQPVPVKVRWDVTPEQVEALARVLCATWTKSRGLKSRWEDYNNGYQDSYLAEARAAFAHIGAVPVGECADCAEAEASWNRVSAAVDGIQAAVTAARAAQKGWELDVTPAEAARAFQKARGDNCSDWQSVLDLCRSRIRPVYECKECAKNIAERNVVYRDWDDCRNRLLKVRLALNEGDES